jgi:hypothetical protein
MKREVGVWIDHTKAIIVTIVGEKDETRRVRSNISKYVHFSGGSYISPHYGIRNNSDISKQDGEFINFLNAYYEGIFSLIRYADSIWIFGPGKAKSELDRYIHHSLFHGQILGIENTEMMTDHQIVAKVRQHYQVKPEFLEIA